MSKKVLITGASGLVGTRLTELLTHQGYEVSHLGRSARTGKVKAFVWDIEKQTYDKKAFEDTSFIIHLAGAGVADKRWTDSRKKEILESRTQSTQLLYKALKETPNNVAAVICASAIGYYGFRGGESIFKEDDKPGNDFLASVTKQWEEKEDLFNSLSKRTVKIRIGIVLSEKGGALKEMATPIRLGVGAPLGTGKQQMSWIHLDDLCRIFIKSIEDETMRGAYNGVCDWITNKKFTQQVARVLKRPLLLPPVPEFVMKLLIGEMGVMVVNGSKVSSEKIRSTGFQFKFPTLEEALHDLLD